MKRTMMLATGATAGLLSALCGIGVSMFAAAVTLGPTATDAVGNRAIRMTPEWLKEFAIAQFGTHDKLALEVGIFSVLSLLAVTAGVLAWRSRALALAVTALLGLVALVAAATDPTTLVGSVSKILPSLAALVSSLIAMAAFARTFHREEAADA